MSTKWFDYSDNPAGVTTYFDVPPPLKDIVVGEIDGSAYFDQWSFRLWFEFPDAAPSIPQGSTFGVSLQFRDVTDLFVRTPPGCKFTTTLTVNKTENGLIHVSSEGDTTINLVCQSFLIESVVHAKSEERTQQTRDLTSYRQLWNSCLIELSEMGYELVIRGNPDPDGGIGYCFFTAVRDSVRLTGRNPVELVGLATIESKFPDFDHQSQIWRRPGPDLLTQLIEEWEESWCKPKK